MNIKTETKSLSLRLGFCVFFKSQRHHPPAMQVQNPLECDKIKRELY